MAIDPIDMTEITARYECGENHPNGVLYPDVIPIGRSPSTRKAIANAGQPVYVRLIRSITGAETVLNNLCDPGGCWWVA